MYGCVTGMGHLTGLGMARGLGLGDDISTATTEVLPMLVSMPSTSIGQMVTSFMVQFPTMLQSDALMAAQNGMVSYLQTQQPTIPASVLAGAIQQLGPSATMDSVTNLASQANVPQNLAALYSMASSGTSHGDASGYSVQIAQPQTIQAAQSTPIAIYTPMPASSNETFMPILDPIPGGGTSVLPGPPPINPQIPVASGTVAPSPGPTNTTSVPILDTSTGNVLPPSAGQTTPVPAVPSAGAGPTGILTPAPSTGAPAVATPFSLCFPGDPSGPISDSIPVCTYTAIGAAIILAFFFMKK